VVAVLMPEGGCWGEALLQGVQQGSWQGSFHCQQCRSCLLLCL
jgi:hypothetical protein